MLIGICFCADINECAVGLVNCHRDADCINTEGSYTCVCHSGLAGTGDHCFSKY